MVRFSRGSKPNLLPLQSVMGGRPAPGNAVGGSSRNSSKSERGLLQVKEKSLPKSNKKIGDPYQNT